MFVLRNTSVADGTRFLQIGQKVFKDLDVTSQQVVVECLFIVTLVVKDSGCGRVWFKKW